MKYQLLYRFYKRGNNIFLLFLFLFLLSYSIQLQSQRFKSGRTINAESETDISMSQFLVTSTTIGITKNSEGDYLRMIKDEESYRLMVSPMDASTLLIMGISMTLPLKCVSENTIYSTIPTLNYDTIFNSLSFAFNFEDINEHFNIQLSLFPQEKIHLHTDRNFYISGEKIWFKAYVTEAATHQFPTFSNYVYVELISPADTLVNRVMIRENNGMFYGNIPITEVIPAGNYTLRAYTRYMENLGDDYFFKKNIRIGKLNGGNGENRNIGASLALAQSDFDISFFPEGGNLVEGSLCKVAFKALNRSGHSETISGKLIDETGVEITDIKTLHAGMGMFVFTPLPGRRYYLKCQNETGREKQFELPQTNPIAYTLTVSLRGNNLLLEVKRPAKASEMPLYLLAHCRGIVLHFSVWDKVKKAAVFAQDQFPAGVIQFVLFDSQMNPLSERLVFSKKEMSEKIEFRTDKEIYNHRDHVISTLLFSDSSDIISQFGHFSVAITDNKDIAVDESTTILSSLLLSSELKGYIETPAFYLQDDPVSNAALDLLMMTHGWRRYNIPEVVKGNLESPKIPFQESLEISGRVKSLIFGRPIANCEILTMSVDGSVDITSTNNNGLFKFSGLDFPDSTSFFIQALNKRGRGDVNLLVDNELLHKSVGVPQNPHLNPTIYKGEVEINPNGFIEKAGLRAQYDEDMWVINLNEVEVTVSKIAKKDDPRLQFWANVASDATISRADIDRFYGVYVSDYLYLTSGIMVYSNGVVSIRGSRGLPVVFIDGVEQTWPESLSHRSQSPLERVTINEIESIDVFKGFGTTIFGMRGANGAISITTKRGNNSPILEKPNHIVYIPLGYQKPIEFYSPKYETLEARQSSLPDCRTTIFWKPDIVISEDKDEVTFDFYTSDFSTTYSVVIEGLTNDGRIVRQVEKIQVK